MHSDSSRPDNGGAPFFIVLNIGSGHGDANTAKTLIGAVLREAGRHHEFFMVQNPDDIDAQARRAVKAASEQGGVVVAAGGDGTLNSVAQIVLESDVTFAVLPQGTFNYFGRTHGISTDTEAATRALLRATAGPAQVGLVNDRLFLVNASIGLYPRIFENRETDKKKFGRFRLVALGSGLMTLLRGYRQMHLLIERDGISLAARTATLFVGNNPLQLQQLGISEADSEQPNQLIAVMPRPVGKLAMLGLVVQGMFGRLSEAKDVDSFAFNTMSVEFRTHRKRQLKVAIDGEVVWETTPLVMRVSPKPLTMLLPAPEDRVVE